MTAIDVAGREGGRVTLSPELVKDLQARIEGPVLRPDDPGWDDAVLVWNAMAAGPPPSWFNRSRPATSPQPSPSPATGGFCSASRAAATTSPAPVSRRVP